MHMLKSLGLSKRPKVYIPRQFQSDILSLYPTNNQSSTMATIQISDAIFEGMKDKVVFITGTLYHHKNEHT